MTTIMRRGLDLRGAALVASDLAVLSGLAVFGIHSHDEALSLHTFARAALTFEAAWLGFGALAGLFGEEWRRPPSHAWRRVLEAWLPAWLVGLIARSLIFSRPLAPGFAAVILLVNGIALVAWRSVFAYLARRAGRGRAERP